jgi:signal transduction histidine kinase
VRLRITVAMVLMVLGTLLLSGAASLFLAARSTTNQTRHEIIREAQSFAVSVPAEAQTGADPARALRGILVALKGPLHLDDSAVLVVLPRPTGPVLYDPASRTPLRPTLPAGLSPADLNPSALLQLQTVSGRTRGIVYAAAPYRASLLIAGRSRDVVQAVVLARRPPSALVAAGPWFGVSSLVILLVAGLVAYRLGRRFVRPIEAAEGVTARIAGGDLAARVPEPAGADPELAALGRSVNSMADALAQAKRSEQQFLQSVSHDLRTPLTSIRGFAEAIEDGATDDAVAAAGVIASEARRLERLVADLLALATLDARRFTLQIQPLDLGEAARRAAAGFAPRAGELGLAIAVVGAAGGGAGGLSGEGGEGLVGTEGGGAGGLSGEGGEGLVGAEGGGAGGRGDSDGTAPPRVGVWADPDRLGQVAANLIENALRFATHQVGVGAANVAGEGRLWVEDDGPGIAPENLDRVFERLFVSRPPAGRFIGTGLGLTIVAELVGAMGGRVWAESPTGPGGGTRMVVALRSARLAGEAPWPAGVSGSAPA